MYQCSSNSTGLEISMHFIGARTQQADLDQRQPNKHVVIVGGKKITYLYHLRIVIY